MPVISADIFQLGAVKLVAGAVPSNPALQLARVTGESIVFTPSTTISAELDPSGQVKDSILTGAASTGSIDGELSRHPLFDLFLEAVMRSTFGAATPQEGDGVLPTPGFSTPTANELLVGSTLPLFMLEKRFRDAAGTGYLYHRFDKTAITTLSLSVSANEPITYSFGVSGGVMTLGTAILTGETYVSAGSRPVFTAPEVTELLIDGVPYCFSSFTIDLNANVRGIDCIGTLGFREQVLGRFEASISGTAYFQSNDILQDLIDQTRFSVTTTLTDGVGNSYKFDFPVCKFTAVPVNASGTNTDVVANLSITPIYTPEWNYTVKVTRVQAA